MFGVSFNGLSGACGRYGPGCGGPTGAREVVVSGMATTTSQFLPLSPRRSPVSSVPQIVVESPTSYEAPMGFTDECPAADRAGPFLPQESQVREDYNFDTIDVLPMYAVSPRNDGYFPSVSPISSPNAMNTQTPQ